MRTQWKWLIGAVAIPLAVGGLSALLTRDSMAAFGSLNQPPLSPPGWVFPVVWTILYTLMGVASWLVLRSDAPSQQKSTALTVYAAQLAVNFFWPIFFFHFGAYLFSFFWLVLLWLLILATTVLFYRIARPAAYLLLPYLAWVTFAGYLNFAIWLLNR